jgi:PAS domain S-box-containing protein
MNIPSPVKSVWSDSVWYTLTILTCIILVSITGYGLIKQQKKFLLKEKHAEISTIADLKKTQLVQWRSERLAEAATIRANTMMGRRINDYIAGRDKAAVRREVRLWLTSLVNLGSYNKAILFNQAGEVIAANSELKTPPSQHYLDHVADAVKYQKIVLSDFHREVPDTPYDIDISIPILFLDGSNSRCVAILVLDIDPAKQLFPLIQTWPTASPTAETLLVMREGDSVLFLNDLRHREKSSSPFRMPLSNVTMPAVRAVLGLEGSFDGVDYRNTAVLSSIKIIPGTRWGLVAKIDTSEVLSPLSKSIWMVMFAGAVVVITMILGVFLLGSRRKAETLRKLFEIEQRHNLELKESEDSLTRSRDYHLKLLEIIPSLIWRSGTDARCDYFNQTWLSFTGRPLEQELGDGWIDGVHPDDLERCVATYKEAFQAQRPFVMEYRLRFNDGSYHWVNDHGRPYYDLNGVFAGYIGCCYDINDQKIAETTLQNIHTQLELQIHERTRDLSEINSLLRREIADREQLEKQLLSAKRLEAIGQIAGGVAHEVRNPLNAILTITEALFREKEIEDNPEFEPFIHHIRSQVNRLVQLMNDLLDLGRTIPTTNLQPLPLYDLCRDTLDLWKSSGMSKNKHGLLTSDSDDLSILVSADALKLQQIFFNLLENAGHYTPVGSRIMMRLSHSSHDLQSGMTVVQIIDQGSGIAEDKLPHVFDPFYTDRKGGTGLGLALVKHFIENMGGTVQIFNTSPPPGCTVEVRIPLYREEPK